MPDLRRWMPPRALSKVFGKPQKRGLTGWPSLEKSVAIGDARAEEHHTLFALFSRPIE